MQRRTFLYNASLGALGVTWFSGFASGLNPQRFVAALDDFFQAIGARAQSWLANDPTLEEAFTHAFVSWKKIGYVPVHNQFYICQQAQKSIFILHLPHPKSGSLDVSALVFQKDIATQNWQFSAALSGFQLEALTKASAVLQPEHAPDRLAGLLLPVLIPLKKQTMGRYATELGEAGICAHLGKDKVMRVEATVYEAGQVLWSSGFVSQYGQSV
ncbi:MAG: hypothetical protein SH848_19895 [Saprospiraceae bacterium]|nr:hypothetical protein [Saprospiraceae bacterium]MDZ4706201.1 hypothetical protein [Saprospiraceae bacterium]